jgi:hypothetical protein
MVSSKTCRWAGDLHCELKCLLHRRRSPVRSWSCKPQRRVVLMIVTMAVLSEAEGMRQTNSPSSLSALYCVRFVRARRFLNFLLGSTPHTKAPKPPGRVWNSINSATSGFVLFTTPDFFTKGGRRRGCRGHWTSFPCAVFSRDSILFCISTFNWHRNYLAQHDQEQNSSHRRSSHVNGHTPLTRLQDHWDETSSLWICILYSQVLEVDISTR